MTPHYRKKTPRQRPAAFEVDPELEQRIRAALPAGQAGTAYSIEQLLVREGGGFLCGAGRAGQPAGCAGVQLFGGPEYVRSSAVMCARVFRRAGVVAVWRLLDHLAGYCPAKARG